MLRKTSFSSLTAIACCAAFALQSLHAQEVRRAEPVETLTGIVPQSTPTPDANSDADSAASPDSDTTRYPAIQPFLTPSDNQHYPKPGSDGANDSGSANNVDDSGNPGHVQYRVKIDLEKQ